MSHDFIARLDARPAGLRPCFLRIFRQTATRLNCI